MCLHSFTNLSLNTITCKVPSTLLSGFVTLKLEKGNGNLYTTTTPHKLYGCALAGLQ